MNNKLLNDFCKLYQNLNKENLAQLKSIYSDNILFIDPMHQLQGIDALITYFTNLYENMDQCRFHIKTIIEEQNEACIVWQMIFSHKKINKGKPILVNGSSHLQFSEKIDNHRDYLDLGEMIYEHLPIIGPVIKTIKKRASQ